jgi:predicted ATPase/DNA-binding SARP family transcriptional activator
MDVRCGEERTIAPRSRRGLWLLALLALRANRDISREWVATTLWPDSNSARETLRRTLTDLRSILGPSRDSLHADHQYLRLNIPEANVDVLAYDALAKGGALSDWEAAVALYRGPLLQECPEFWIDQDRTLRSGTYIDTLVRAAAVYRERGDPVSAVRCLRLATHEDPFRDAVHRALMEALISNGEPAEAILTYRRLRERLREDTGAEPSAETTALFRQLRSPSVPPPYGRRVPKLSTISTPAAASASNLPRPLTALVGRECEIADLGAAVKRSRMVTVSGTGGLGKTRLAIETAYHLQTEFPDGVWFVDLSGVSDPALVPRTVASVFVVSEKSGEDVTVSLSKTLRNQNLLIILDNCEHLIDAAAVVVRSLVRDCPGLHFLATSRQALRLTGEVIYRLEPLEMPDGMPAAVLSSDALVCLLDRAPALRLFVERASAVQPAFAVSSATLSASAEICRRLDGIPLALELAAARVRSLSVEQIAHRLENRFRLLTTGDRAAQPRQHSLRALIDWSYDMLTADEKSLFARLSVFAGGWTADAAAAVCAGDETAVRDAGSLAEADVIDLLDSLVEKSLILAERGEAGEMRFRMLETLREYAREKLTEQGDAEATRSAHVTWFLGFTEESEKTRSSQDQYQWLSRFREDRDNIRQALQSAQPGLERLRFAVAMSWPWYLLGQYAEGRDWYLQALSEAPDAPVALRSRAIKGAGDLSWAQGELEPARRYHEENLALVTAANDTMGIAVALSSLGLVSFRQGDNDAAIAYYRQGLQGLRQLDDRRRIAVALLNLALAVRASGDYAEATELLAESGTIFGEIHDQQGVGNVRHSQSLLAKGVGDYALARRYAEESLQIDRAVGHFKGIATGLHTLGEIAIYERDWDASDRYLNEAANAFRSIGARDSVCATVQSLAELETSRGNVVAARDYLREALQVQVDLENRAGMIDSLRGAARLEILEGRPARAARLLAAVFEETTRRGAAFAPAMHREFDGFVADVRAALGDTAFEAAWAEGTALGLRPAVEYTELL